MGIAFSHRYSASRTLMVAITPTRTELLRRRSQIAFAQQGRNLIWDKRSALMREFRLLDADIMSALAEVQRSGMRARTSLREAQARDGAAAVNSAALAAAQGVCVARTDRYVAGVRIVSVDPGKVVRDDTSRGVAPVLVSASVTATSEAYERYLEGVLKVSALELTVRRLAAEISRSTRQVNALDNVVIPELEAEATAIRSVLDEREREERVRLQRARDKLRGRVPPPPLTSLAADDRT